MKRRKHHIGRLRIKAAEILAKEFPDWDVRPEDIVPASGWYRTAFAADVYRWELFSRTTTGMPIVAGCWETLTDFVSLAGKFGCHCHDQEIWPNTKPTKLVDILT